MHTLLTLFTPSVCAELLALAAAWGLLAGVQMVFTVCSAGRNGGLAAGRSADAAR
jgi:hypothetical protein